MRWLTWGIQERSSGNPINPKAWLYRVVRNLIVSGSRRAEVARRHSPALAVADVLEDSGEAWMLTREQNDTLDAALGVVRRSEPNEPAARRRGLHGKRDREGARTERRRYADHHLSSAQSRPAAAGQLLSPGRPLIQVTAT